MSVALDLSSFFYLITIGHFQEVSLVILVKLEILFLPLQTISYGDCICVGEFVVLFVYLFIQTINVTETDKQANKNEKLRIDPYNH